MKKISLSVHSLHISQQLELLSSKLSMSILRTGREGGGRKCSGAGGGRKCFADIQNFQTYKTSGHNVHCYNCEAIEI